MMLVAAIKHDNALRLNFQVMFLSVLYKWFHEVVKLASCPDNSLITPLNILNVIQLVMLAFSVLIGRIIP